MACITMLPHAGRSGNVKEYMSVYLGDSDCREQMQSWT